MTQRITPPDPTMFPTPTARAVAWLTALAAIPDIHPDDRRLAMDAVTEAAGTTVLEALAFCSRLGATATNLLKMAHCGCGSPNCDPVNVMVFTDARTGDTASIEDAIADPTTRTIVQAIFANANGDDRDAYTLLEQAAAATTAELLAGHVTAFLTVANAALPNIPRSTPTT